MVSISKSESNDKVEAVHIWRGFWLCLNTIRGGLMNRKEQKIVMLPAATTEGKKSSRRIKLNEAQANYVKQLVVEKVDELGLEKEAFRNDLKHYLAVG